MQDKEFDLCATVKMAENIHRYTHFQTHAYRKYLIIAAQRRSVWECKIKTWEYETTCVLRTYFSGGLSL